MDDHKTLRQVVEMVVADKFSEEVREVVECLPDHTEEAAASFCDRFDLGTWFYEALTLNDVDVRDWLADIADHKQVEENESASDRAEHERDYRSLQGVPA